MGLGFFFTKFLTFVFPVIPNLKFFPFSKPNSNSPFRLVAETDLSDLVYRSSRSPKFQATENITEKNRKNMILIPLLDN